MPTAQEAGVKEPLPSMPLRPLPIAGPDDPEREAAWNDFQSKASRGNATFPMNTAVQDNTRTVPLMIVDEEQNRRLERKPVELEPAYVEKMPIGRLTLPQGLFTDTNTYQSEINAFKKDMKPNPEAYQYNFEEPLARKWIQADKRKDPASKKMMDKFWSYVMSVGDQVLEASDKTGVPESLLYAFLVREGGGPGIVSNKGAIGYGQFTPVTRKEMRRLGNGSMRKVMRDMDLSEQAFAVDPRTGVMGMAVYLRRLLDMFDGNIDAVLSSYNGGPNATRNNGVLRNKETLTYAYYVQEYEKYYRKLLHSLRYGTVKI